MVIRKIFAFQKNVIILYKHDGDQTCYSKILDFDIRLVDSSNVSDALLLDRPTWIELFKDFLKSGDHGYYAYLDNEMVHRSWVKFGPDSVETWGPYAPLPLQPGEAFIHFCRTSEKARGRGIYPAVLSRIVSDCRLQGIKDVFISTSLDNLASRRGVEKAGFVEIERRSMKVYFGIPFYSPSNWAARS